MKQIDTVTMTGADDTVNPEQLLQISNRYPFVEWGILVSHTWTTGDGSPRWPSVRWITDLQSLAEKTGGLRLCLHVCGRWVRHLLQGRVEIPSHLLHCMSRVQLNFHREAVNYSPQLFAEAAKSIERPLLFQFDGVKGQEYLEAYHEFDGDGYALFDLSGGAGVVPQKWPSPIYLNVAPNADGEPQEYFDYHGYAGGLGPHNLREMIPKILEAANPDPGHTDPGRIWIDMETHIRSAGDGVFDLSKVCECLEVSRPFVMGG